MADKLFKEVEEYSFKVKTCYCGANLSGLKAEATSNRFGTLPQGKCPECGRNMLLVGEAVFIKVPVEEAPKAPAKSTSKK